MIVDLVVGAVVLLSAAIAFMRGFIREILTVVGVVGGCIAAIIFGDRLAPTFRNWLNVDVEGGDAQKLLDLVPMGVVADVLAYGAIFIVVVIVLSVVSHFTSGAVKAMGLGPIDRTLGVIFGIARALVLLGLFYLPFHLLMDSDTKAEIFADSRTHMFIEKTAEAIAGFLPESEDVKGTAEEKIKQKLQDQDLLRKDGAGKPPPPIEKKAVPENEDGYKDQQREKLDRLFTAPNYNE